MEEDMPGMPAGSELVLATAAALAIYAVKPVVEKLRAPVRRSWSALDRSLYNFFTNERAEKVAIERHLDSYGATLAGIADEAEVQEIGRERATRFEITAAGAILGGVLVGGNIRRRLVGVVVGGVTAFTGGALKKYFNGIDPKA